MTRRQRINPMRAVAPIFALLTVLLGCILLVAYSGGRPDNGDDVVTLRFWHPWGGYEGKFLQGLVDEFNREHPHIQVQASQFSVGDKLLAAIAGGKPPDVATVWSFMLTPMGEGGAFLPLEGRMAADPEVHKALKEPRFGVTRRFPNPLGGTHIPLALQAQPIRQMTP